jgi:hypothetical protein
MSEHVDRIDNPALKQQWAGYIKFLDEINSKQWLIYVKEFYIVLPYYPGEQDKSQVRKPWWRLFLDAWYKVCCDVSALFEYISYVFSMR